MHLKMFTDDYEFVIAESVADVKAILVELHYSPECFDPDHWTAMDESRDFTYVDDANVERTKTVREWIDAVGRGYFACEQ